jgi:hypothetical protein
MRVGYYNLNRKLRAHFRNSADMVTKALFRDRHDDQTCESAILDWKIRQLEKALATHAGLYVAAWPTLDAKVSPTECRAYGNVTADGEISFTNKAPEPAYWDDDEGADEPEAAPADGSAELIARYKDMSEAAKKIEHEWIMRRLHHETPDNPSEFLMLFQSATAPEQKAFRKFLVMAPA